MPWDATTNRNEEPDNIVVENIEFNAIDVDRE